MLQRYLIEGIVFLYMVVFSYASFTKIADWEKFVIQIKQSPVLSGLGSWIPPTVIVLELVIVLMLAFPSLRKAALFGALGLMSMFTAYIVVIMNFASYVPCSCGGILEQLTWSEHLIFNIIMMLMAAYAILFQAERKDTVAKKKTSFT